MGYEDRDYHRGGEWRDEDPMDGFNTAMRWLNKDFKLFRISGVLVKVHIWFIIFFCLWMVTHLEMWQWHLGVQVTLFVSVLLHEFGHVFACRWVGGYANEILMWPLGGLAFCDPPKNARANFITTAGGPLVNVVLMVLSYALLVGLYGFGQTGLGWNPFEPLYYYSDNWFGKAGQMIFTVNYVLLLFNIALLFYPFDGGRLVQAVIWHFTNYKKGMKFAITTGVVGSAVVILIAIVMKEVMLALIGVFGLYACYQQAQHLKMQMEMGDTSGGEGWLDLPESFDATGAGRGGGGSREPDGPSWREKRKAKKEAEKQAREAEREKAHEAEVDRVLAKVAKSGMESLSKKEKDVLAEETRRKRGE